MGQLCVGGFFPRLQSWDHLGLGGYPELQSLLHKGELPVLHK